MSFKEGLDRKERIPSIHCTLCGSVGWTHERSGTRVVVSSDLYARHWHWACTWVLGHPEWVYQWVGW